MRIFVSSTFVDLQPDRQAAIEALRRAQLDPWGMEWFVSEPSYPLDVCLQELRQSDAVILMIGFYAGSLIPGSPGITYTRAEFEFAKQLDKPVFVFFKLEGGRPVNKETDPAKRAALDDFRNAVTSWKVTPQYYDSLDRLQVEVLVALQRWDAQGRPGARRVFTTPAEHFAPYDSGVPRLFDYKQQLRGREKELQELRQFLNDDSKIVGLLSGRGGIGKSKLLRDWTQSVKDRTILFVREDAEWHGEAAKEIPAGKVLIIADDVQRFGSLDRLLLLVRGMRTRQDVKILLGSRPTGLGPIDNSLAGVFDSATVFRLPPLERISSQGVKELALEVLGTEHSPSRAGADRCLRRHTARNGHRRPLNRSRGNFARVARQ